MYAINHIYRGHLDNVTTLLHDHPEHRHITNILIHGG